MLDWWVCWGSPYKISSVAKWQSYMAQAASYELWKEFWPEFTTVEFIAAHKKCTVILDKYGHFYAEQTIQHVCAFLAKQIILLFKNKNKTLHMLQNYTYHSLF